MSIYEVKAELLYKIIEAQDELIKVDTEQKNILADNKSMDVIAFIGLKGLENELIDKITKLKQQAGL